MLVTCNDVALGYEGKRMISHINFSVSEGAYLCIIGANGSGKSTLLKGLLGLIRPMEGTIKYGDGLKQNEVGYLPQQHKIQRDFPASVYEVVLSGRLNRRGFMPFYTREDRLAADRNLEKLKMLAYRNVSYADMSGGQQQRVLLARALCASSRLLLLDEPVSGLDPVASADLYATIDDLNHNYGVTVIMVSHDMHSAIDQASHILHMGHVPLFFGPTADYLKTELACSFVRGEHIHA